MKFEAAMVRTEEKRIAVFADTRDDAMALLQKAHPGFSVTEVTDLLDGDERGATHAVMSHCSACGATIWEGDVYHSGEDADLCALCGNTSLEL